MTNPTEQNIFRHTNIPLPAYRHIPKETKCPDLAEYLSPILKQELSTFEFSEQTWHKSFIYLYAIDLFNHEFYWEVHEVLEILWMEKGKSSPIGKFLQGIIQLSVALLKKKQSNQKGLELLVSKALPKLNSKTGIYLGIDIENLLFQFNAFVKENSVIPPTIRLNFGSKS